MFCVKYNLSLRKIPFTSLQVFQFLKGFLFLLAFLIPSIVKSQQSIVPLNHSWIQDVEANMVQAKGFVLANALMSYEQDAVLLSFLKQSDTINGVTTTVVLPLHSSMRPWLERGHPLLKNRCLQNSTNEHTLISTESRWPKSVLNYHSRKSLINIEREAQNGEPIFRLYIDPVLNLQFMRMNKDESDTLSGKFYTNTRGVSVHGDIGGKLSFGTSFYENQAFVPTYIKDFAQSQKVIPGQGKWKAFKAGGYDYAFANGFLSFSPGQNFNVQIGTGKHFVGDGYRSLLLSDNSFNYPYARLTGWFGSNRMFQYTTIYASLMNLNSVAPVPLGTEKLYQKKAASFYELSVNLGRTAAFSLFQGLIWSAADDRNKQCIQLAYINPIIFTSVPFYGLKDKRNFLLGATFHLDLFKTTRLYGQILTDDFGTAGTLANKKGFQVGIKYFNVARIKHLHLQFEYSTVNPYTYASSDAAQSYTHYNQALAHPLGANFSEGIVLGKYKIGDFFTQVRFSQALVGADTSGFDFGQNVLTSDSYSTLAPSNGAIKTGQGRSTSVTYFDASIGYMINYASNLNVCIGFVDRGVSTALSYLQTQYFYVAIRTSLTNEYLDFFWK